MKPVDFPGCNVTFAKDQPEYQPLPAIKINSPQGEVISCWELSDEEIERLKVTRKVYLSMWTFNNPLTPVILTTDLNELVPATAR